ncbi:unnamed protein product [Coffea canephora]|uniref:Uncharacterized protein n=1 Tax=Coffea canephora TaxID=49390 RepID=A0A068VBP7_COFCA|nr:unnamed protein product [Coffea canephora]
MSSSTSSDLVLNKTNSNKLDYLYEVSVEPKVVDPTSHPVINPYSVYGKQSFSPPGRELGGAVTHQPKGVKEYIQASKVDQHPILATKKEQLLLFIFQLIFLPHGKNRDTLIFILEPSEYHSPSMEEKASNSGSSSFTRHKIYKVSVCLHSNC